MSASVPLEASGKKSHPFTKATIEPPPVPPAKWLRTGVIVTVILPMCESDASSAIGLPMFATMCGYVSWSNSFANVWYHAESGRRLFGQA